MMQGPINIIFCGVFKSHSFIHSFIHLYSALEAGVAGTRAQSCERYGSGTLQFVIAFPLPLDLPTFAARCLYVCNDARDPSSERWNCGREICPVILPKFRLPRKSFAWDRRLYFPSEGRRAEDFFSPQKSDGFGRV